MNGKIRSISSRLREFQSIMNEYYRFDPKNIEQLTEHAASGFNAWAEGQRNNLEAMHGKLESDMDHIRGIEKKHAELKTWLDGDNSSADNYSARVEEFNDFVQQHNVLAGDFDGQQKQYNVEVKKFNRELSERQKRVNDEIGNANDTIATFNKWFNKNKDEVFYKELNAFFTELRRLEASHNYDSTELGECLQTVRSIKDELGRYAIEKENEKPDGFLICPVKLCGAEKCYMIVDTASNMVSINRELVEALDLNDYIGETIELRLANRIKINAPQLLIPGITVFDRETEYVKGVILDEPLVGVDGCLGMSFLNRYDFKIDKMDIPPLTLREKQRSAAGQEYDVFINYKSDDLSYAKTVYEFLAKSGYTPFLDKKSIPKTGSTEYQPIIDAALENANHLIIVSSSKKNVISPWVQSEWRLFDGLVRSGRKPGNIVPLLCGTMSVEELPFCLVNRYMAISMDDRDWRETLIKCLPRGPRGT